MFISRIVINDTNIYFNKDSKEYKNNLILFINNEYYTIHYKKKRILVVDEDRELADFFSEALKRCDRDIIVAGKSREAIDKVNAGSFQLILVDANMPQVERENLYIKLKKMTEEKKTPIVIMSGSGLESSLIQAVKDGVANFILKPCQIGELRDKVDKYLRVPRKGHRR